MTPLKRAAGMAEQERARGRATAWAQGRRRAISWAWPVVWQRFADSNDFVRDEDSRPSRPVFNRTVGLRDTWAKMAQKG